MLACLSWSTPLQKAHWSGPACWYAGIVLSLTAIVLGAQQTMYIPGAIPSPAPPKTTSEVTIDEDSALTFQKYLRRRPHSNEANGDSDGEGGHGRKPRKYMLFVWQTPLMLFTYSVAFFLAGMSSVVLSPLVAQGVGWTDEAKTVVIYAVAVAVGFGTFLSTSIGLISGFGQRWRGPSRRGQIGFLDQK